MDLSFFSGHGYVLIDGLLVIGICLDPRLWYGLAEDESDVTYAADQQWIEAAAPVLGKFEAGGQNCYEMLRWSPKGG